MLKCSLSGQISFMLLPVLFPGPKQRCSSGPASGGAKCVHGSVCVFCESLCVRVRACFLWVCPEASSSSRSPLETESPVVSPLIWLWSSLGRGRKKQSVCVCARASRVCPLRAHEWWGQVGNSPMLIKTPPASSPKPPPSAACRRAKTSKGRVPKSSHAGPPIPVKSLMRWKHLGEGIGLCVRFF